jgi:hypothetical protein
MGNVAAEGAFAACMVEVNQYLSGQLKVLLETKHLYQKVSFEIQPIVDKHRESVVGGFAGIYDNYVKQQIGQPIVVSSQELWVQVGQGRAPQMTFVLQNVILSCATCKKQHGFRLLSGRDAATVSAKFPARQVQNNVA